MASPSSDEGEIMEGVTENLKATSLPKTERNGVDRQNRTRRRHSPYKSPEHPSRTSESRRSRSPRGFKRGRDDRDHYRGDRGDRGGRGGQDPRRFRVHYEDGRNDYRGDYRGDYRRNRVSYEDLDRPPTAPANHGYAGRDRDRDGYPDKRARHRSRSPPRQPRGGRQREDRYGRGGGRRFDGRDVKYDQKDRNSLRDTATKRDTQGEAPRFRTEEAKPGKGHADDTQSQATISQAARVEEEPEEAYEEPEPIDEEAEIERRRRRREELLAKLSSTAPTPLLVDAVTRSADGSTAASPRPHRQDTPQREDTGTPASGPGTPASHEMHDGSSPGEMEILNDVDLMNIHSKAAAAEEDGPSAADYDPTVDMREDGLRDERRHGNVGLHGEVVDEPQEEKVPVPQAPGGKQASGENDDDDDFDMFAEDFDVDRYAANKASKEEEAREENGDGGAAAAGGMLDGQDKDGYYKVRIGEVLNGRYQVQSVLGKGMFSGVVRAEDITNKKPVAIKIMRNNDALRKGGYTEIAILEKLNEADPDNRKHIVKFHRHFDHMGHLCMAFENLSLNLREVLKKFGNNVGINLNAVRTYAYQIFVALAHMRKCSIIHADLKPDNILVSENRNILKICDLGTAIDRQDAATAHNELTPYLVSRFYRAPEIILGIPYDYSVDMWSIGCTLYELYTGKILFTGDSNNQMLKTIMEIRGRLMPKMYKRGQLAGAHFDDKGNFISVERDEILNKSTVKTYTIVKPTRDLRTRLMAASAGMSDSETRNLNLFVDLLEHCLALNPDKRYKPSDALRHPFFTTAAVAPKVSKR